MPVTISEIAKLANVSRTTVSYVLNNKGNIPQVTRDKVLEVIRETGYIPNANARNLAIGKNLKIGVFVPSVEYLRKSVFFSEVSAAILSVINQHGMDLVIEIYDNVYERWLQNSAGLDGAILINPKNDEKYVKLLQAAKIPALVVGRTEKFEEFAFVDGPNIQLAYDMTRTLVEYGHKNILYILPNEKYTLTSDFSNGIDSFLQESKEEIRILRLYSEYGMDISETMIQDCFKRLENISAVVVDSDYKAVQVLNLLKKMGKRVPEDISLTCLAGSYLTDIPSPCIYSLKLDNFLLGELVAKKMIAIIEGEEDATENICREYSIQAGESLRYA